MTDVAVETERAEADAPEDGAPPAHGQLVTVRNRPWVVSGVARSAVSAEDPARTAAASATHLVDLVSVEDDARDEELRVIWELEQGAVVHQRYELPSPADGIDAPERLDAFLDAVRWGAIASADKTALQAPFRSGAEIQDYQLAPVVRALSMPRTNLLIADDVGLGKTIEAGLVMQELMLRHRARTMLIVCPSGLTLQWQDEMRDKFGLDFRIVNSALLRELRRSRGPHAANPWLHYPRLIVSVDWLKRERPMRMLREVLPHLPEYPRAFDLLVVDEVHTCAPSGTGRYAVDSQRTKAIRALAPHCEHRLFLSATPHNGFLESFTALLELLDDHRFARGVKPSDEQLRRVMVRRLKSELPKTWDGRPRFPERVAHALEVRYETEARAAYAKLSAYARSRRETGDTGTARTAADFVTTLLKKRFLSSPKAFAETIDVHLKTMTEGPAAERAPSEKVLRPLIERVEETAEDDEEHAEAAERALTAARQASRSLTAAEHTQLKELSAWARTAVKRPDAKFTALRGWLDAVVRPDGPAGDWAPDRVIVFTEYRDTQRWLFDRLIAAGYPAERIAQLYGGQKPQEREHIKTVFQEDPSLSPVRILFARTPPARASTSRPTATASCTGRSRGTRTAWSSATAASTGTANGRTRWTSSTSSPRAGRASPPSTTPPPPCTRTAPWRTSSTSWPSPPARRSRSARTWAARARSSRRRSSRRCWAVAPTGRRQTPRSAGGPARPCSRRTGTSPGSWRSSSPGSPAAATPCT
ncbi:DISARM system SNF2-like helicase DrmD [Streptomyces sp. NPDC057249]|uniref:DISARM system SNF2-like helicase DrmD n=1 Tax=Streptomyces sp. NPDC057249 TaxID=3346067 RepID=UPI00363A9211